MRTSIIVFVCAIMLSCGNKTQDYFSNLDRYSFESIPTTELDQKDVIYRENDDIDISYPYNMVCINDNIIAIRDKDHKSQIKIINIDNHTIDGFVPIGEAPQEMLRVNSMTQFNGSIWLGSSFDNKFGRINIQEDSLFFEILGKTKDPFLYAIPLDKQGSNVMTCPAIPDKVRFLVTDLRTQKDKEVGKFPINNYEVNNAILQGEAALTPDGSRIVAIDKSWGIIEIYNTEDFSVISMTQGPDNVSSEIVVMEEPRGIRYFQNPMYTVLSGLSVAKDAFFVGYKGICYDNPEAKDNGISRIIKYDYQGKPLRQYKLPFHLLSFTANHNGDTLYGIQEDAESGDMKLIEINL